MHAFELLGVGVRNLTLGGLHVRLQKAGWIEPSYLLTEHACLCLSASFRLSDTHTALFCQVLFQSFNAFNEEEDERLKSKGYMWSLAKMVC